MVEVRKGNPVGTTMKIWILRCCRHGDISMKSEILKKKKKEKKSKNYLRGDE